MEWFNHYRTHEVMLCMTEAQANNILKGLKLGTGRLKMQRDKYIDIHEGGEATEKQEDRRQDFIDIFEDVSCFLKLVEGRNEVNEYRERTFSKRWQENLEKEGEI